MRRFSLGSSTREQRVPVPRRGADIFGQFSNSNRFHVDDPSAVVGKFEFRIHVLPFPNVDRLHDLLWHGPRQIYVQQAIFHNGLTDIHTFRENERPLELARCDPAMQENAPVAVVGLTTPNNQLVIFNSD